MFNAKVLCLIGGISKNSLNRKLYNAFKEEAPEGIEIDDFKIEQLPFYSQDIENDPPAIARDFKNRVKEARAILFITPEYNRSFPGVLKNAIDWASRPYGQSLWDKKTAAVVGASVGNIGTFGAQQQLRQVLGYLNMRTMGQPEFYLNASKSFDTEGKMTDESNRKFIKSYWTAFQNWINTNNM